MKFILLRSILPIYLLFAAAYSCGQNGPTQPTVNLSWTQSTTPGVTANCVYRGSTVAGKYDLPAMFCSTLPVTSFTDQTVVRGTTYHYAVTAQVGKTEGGYSNDAVATVPQSPAPPSLNLPTETKMLPNALPITADLVANVQWIQKSARR